MGHHCPFRRHTKGHPDLVFVFPDRVRGSRRVRPALVALGGNSTSEPDLWTLASLIVYGSTPGARRVQTQTPRGARVQNREFCTAHRKESSYTSDIRQCIRLMKTDICSRC
ncbi:hypothetical protein SCLCIDRAFT_1207281 [Scleroderma citrinum Foug A]|uniref:Uncharacterized protein n=1 Tax=Scleroderma citrinum Foug A TaxID=1036808 RepID=A0A0C3EQ99_9AGAM|nr:hypothetical protein SCLCIDRAFT_1207281 [Scleroderma citrinum Foug A]